MTSFLNKKLNLILLVLATLIVITTISSVSAANENNSVQVSFGTDNVSAIKNVTHGSVITLNGTIGGPGSNAVGLNATTDNINNNTVNNPNQTLNGTLEVFVCDGAENRSILNKTINTREWSLDINTSTIDNLGISKIWVYFKGGTVPEVPAWHFQNGSSNILSLEMKDTPTITISSIDGTHKVGQEATFLVTVTGRNDSNASQIINLTNVTVNIIDQLGKLVVNNVTNVNGTFNFTYLVTALSFYFNATTNISADPTLSEFYTEANASVPFNATKGQANLTELWFDSPWGYVIGQPATILWSFTGIALDTIGNRTITLFYYSNNILQRTEVVPLYAPLSLDNRSASGHWNTTFTQAHDNLTVIAVFAEDPEYLRSEVRNSTFVDISNESRRTTITASFPQDGLKVGVTSDIKIYVRTFDNKTVNSGSVSVLWDGQWRFDVDVVNGEATFIHTYTQAGAARNVTFTYNGEEAGTRASSVTETVPVLKGTPSIVLTQNPQFVSVGQEVTIAGAINNFALGNNPEYVNLTFKAGEHVWHTINDIAMTFNTNSSAVAQVTYIYTMAHSNLSLVMSFVGNDNYNAASGTITTIVSPAPTI